MTLSDQPILNASNCAMVSGVGAVDCQLKANYNLQPMMPEDFVLPELVLERTLELFVQLASLGYYL